MSAHVAPHALLTRQEGGQPPACIIRTIDRYVARGFRDLAGLDDLQAEAQ